MGGWEDGRPATRHEDDSGVAACPLCGPVGPTRQEEAI